MTVRVGLVLGAGGTSGLAFHAGVLWSLHHDLGWDGRDAEVVVGTSAGSIVGALLRGGVSPEDLAAWASEASPSASGSAFRALMRRADHLPATATFPSLTLPGRAVLGLLTKPSQLGAALTTVLPHGVADQAPRLAMMIDRLLPSWPTKTLWIAAVRVGDGRLTWFGRPRSAAPRGPGALVDVDRLDPVPAPAQAVAASCAIPVLARPVRIGRHRYVDGGVRSPTNADVLAGQDLDLVLVSSPMGPLRGASVRSPSRRLAQRRLAREVRILEARGLEVQVVSPDPETITAMGWNMLDRSGTAAVMRAAFLGTTSQLGPAVAARFHRTQTAP